MKDKVRYDFVPQEMDIVLRSLNLLRNNLTLQERTTDAVDEILSKISTNKFYFYKYELNIIIKALNTYRYKLKNLNEPRTEVNETLLKLIDYTENMDCKKKLLLRRLIPGNGRY